MKKNLFANLLFMGLLLMNTSCAKAQKSYSTDNPAYVIYNDNGRKVSYSEMLRSIAQADVSLFGELHNDPVSHWLELSILKDLHSMKGEKLVVGAEMWESDNQLVLDEFLSDEQMDMNTYTENSVLWKNFATDYRPLLSYAKENNLRFVATNIPRRYARMVSQRGDGVLDSLSSDAKELIAPLPIHIDLKEEFYEYIADVFKETRRTPMKGSSLANLVKAQAVKDATMAWFIVNNLKDNGHFFHFNGELHSAFRSAIAYYIEHYEPSVSFRTISVIKKSDVMDFSSGESRADFNIVVPANMTMTYVD
jgi:uncharacterized iron-regulated protein